MTNPFTNLVQFVESEQLEQQLASQKKALLDRLILIDTEHANREALIKQAKDRAQSVQKRMNESELERKTAREREKTLRSKLDTLQSAKEYTASMHELDDLERIQTKSEEKFLSLLGEQETAQKDLKTTEESFKIWGEESNKLKESLKKSIRDIDERANITHTQALEYKKWVNPETLAQYEHMKQTVKDPFVSVLDAQCSACRCVISQRDLTRLIRHVLVSCNNCYRILYSKE